MKNEKILNSFLNRIGQISEMKYLLALRDGMVITIPFTILGSVFLIIGNLPFEGWANTIEPLIKFINPLINVTFGLLSIIVLVGISYQMSTLNRIDHMSGTIISLIAYIIAMLNKDFEIDTSSYGASGMFTAIIVAIVAGELLSFFYKKNWTIKLPDSVPPAVMKSFSALIPGSLTLLFFWFFRVVLNFDINQFITWIFSPLVTGANSFFGIMFICFLMCFLWTLGIHGNNIVGSVSGPIFLAFLAGNIEAVKLGNEVPYIAADGFLLFGMNLGGTGAIIGLAICLLLTKSERYKTLGKMSIFPSIFGISEPIMFGVPVVLNPILAIPFIAIPLVLQGITYFLIKYTIISPVIAAAPWTTPPIISGFLITGGDWRAALWQGIEVIIAVVVYYPFVKKIDSLELEIQN